MKVNGDRMAFAKGVPNGDLHKVSTKQPPAAGAMSGLDKPRFGSARNTAKDYTNPKKIVLGLNGLK